jgi:glycosyltransferase involved in cell wall biosynthesis
VKEGLEVAGRPVELNIYGACCPPDLQGPNVTWHGLVDSEEIPGVLAGADALLLGVTFSDSPKLVELVKTCIYTKTVDYLAANRPLLIVAPSYAAEVKHFRDVATVVDSPAPERIGRALEQIASDGADIREQRRRGLEMVSQHHSSEVVTADFLEAFSRQAA